MGDRGTTLKEWLGAVAWRNSGNMEQLQLGPWGTISLDPFVESQCPVANQQASR